MAPRSRLVETFSKHFPFITCCAAEVIEKFVPESDWEKLIRMAREDGLTDLIVDATTACAMIDTMLHEPVMLLEKGGLLHPQVEKELREHRLSRVREIEAYACSLVIGQHPDTLDPKEALSKPYYAFVRTKLIKAEVNFELLNMLGMKSLHEDSANSMVLAKEAAVAATLYL